MTEQCGCNVHGHGTTVPCPCGCGADISIYSSKGCNCGCGCSCSDKFLKLADEAWMEVLKEKIKCQIIAHKSEQMDKLAEVIAKANGEKWKHKIASKTKNNDYKDTLKEFFSSEV